MERFGKFELVRRLGAGGMGEVFLARAPELGQVVVKRILPHLTENARFLRLFLDETRIAARLTHPNIARIHELGEVGDTWYVAMELVQGKDLRHLLKRTREQGGSVPVPVALFIAREIALALAYAHGLKDASGKLLQVVHRDVSPHNIVISSGGAVKLIDFGVARAANKSVHTASGILKGKFPYMAPEQAQAKKVDARTDVFALGIVLWEMVTGQSLFRGKTDAATLKAVRACDVVPPSRIDPIIPRPVDKIAMRALQKDPKDRYPNAEAMREALDEAMAGMAAPAIVQFYRELDDVPGLDDSGEIETADGPKVSSQEITMMEGDVESVDTVHYRHTPELSISGRTGAGLKRVRKLLSELAERPTNLAPPPSTFVGRVAELADLQQIFRQGFRLLTMVGPGGTGKTRLATQFAGQLVSHFKPGEGGKKGGVWFVDLTDARDVDAICAAVAQALSVPLSPGDVVQQLGHVIASRGEVLLVLDNFEQVSDFAEGTVGAWLATAPGVRFVVTSRQLLKVVGETVFEVPPLRVPVKNEDARKAEAVMLFIERARAARPGWQPSETDELAMADLVRQLDGMPLAIELAASRMGTMNAQQLVQRLPRRFELLGGSAPGPTERQATLRGAIDWSWRSLTSQEAAVLAQCAVFRGGFTIDAAEAVVSLRHFEEPPSVLEVLLTLRSKSLIRSYYPRGDEMDPRYGLYESIREYAFEKLQDTPMERAASERHARYFLELGSQLAVTADGNVEQLDWLELERDNLYAVFQRSLAHDEMGSRALLAVAALDPLLTLRGPFSHHVGMVEAAMERLGDDAAALASAYELLGRAKQARGKTQDAGDDYARMLELARQTDNEAVEGRAEFYLGLVNRLRGQRRDAQGHFERALLLLRRVKDRRMEGRTLSSLAVLLHEMNLENEATSAYQRALEIHRAVGDRRYEGITLANLGVLQQAQGLLSQSRQQYEQALAIHRELGNRRSEGISHINLGDLNRDLEKFGAADNHYRSALEILREVGARRFEGVALFSLGSWHQEQGHAQAAAERFREALPLLAEADDRRYGGLAMIALAAADAALGHDAEIDEALEEGTRLLNEAGDASFIDALDVYHSLIDLARARRAGEPVPPSVLRRAEHAERSGPPGKEYPAGAPSPAERSEQVRAALRSLRAAIKNAPSPQAGRGRG